ncbi:hypothetical protein PENSPDRAFT_680647 [Peniophora sp. CONT]|nr:hypothetical protein PENSPDRAFT_680647 [Peniophora sp. CONT]
MLRDLYWAGFTVLCFIASYAYIRRIRSRPLFSYRDPSAVTILVADEVGNMTTVNLHADEVTALRSEGPLDPVILQSTVHEAGQGAALVLDWFSPDWTRDVNGQFLFRAREVRAAVAIARDGIPMRLVGLVHRIGVGELTDTHAQYQGIASFMLFIQAHAALIHRISTHIAEELYPVDPSRLRSALVGMRGQLNPVELFRSATILNDGILMILSASHAMYEYRLYARTVDPPRGIFEGVDADTVIRIRSCAKLAADLTAAHLAKGRFQHYLLEAETCDVNSLNHLHGWRPRPMIASGTIAPNASLACDPIETYGLAPSTTTTLSELLAADVTGLALRTRLAALQAIYPSRRGPCYQACLVYMIRRVEDARVWGIFPPPTARENGNDERPCEDTRSPSLPSAGSWMFPCASCRKTTGDFVNTQLTKVARLIRDMFENGSSNYFGIDIHSLRTMALRQPGVDDELFPPDLEHVFDDILGPFSHPNVATHGNVDLPWSEWTTNATGGWGGGGGGWGDAGDNGAW